LCVDIDDLINEKRLELRQSHDRFCLGVVVAALRNVALRGAGQQTAPTHEGADETFNDAAVMRRIHGSILDIDAELTAATLQSL